MIFIETILFTSLLPGYLNDNEYRKLQNYLAEQPEAGSLIRGSGGIRKIRWARAGMGKSGGVRVIYYWAAPREHIHMLAIYSKSERENIDAATLNRIAKQLEVLK